MVVVGDGGGGGATAMTVGFMRGRGGRGFLVLDGRAEGGAGRGLEGKREGEAERGGGAREGGNEDEFMVVGGEAERE